MARNPGSVFSIVKLDKFVKDKAVPLLSLVCVVTIGLIIFVYITARDTPRESPVVSEMQQEASLSMEGIRMASTRDGVKAWSLTAESGYYFDNRQQAVFNNITVLFHQKEGGEVILTADKGLYRSASNDLELSGHVVIKNDQYQIESSQFQYEHKPGILKSNFPVSVIGQSVTLKADTVAYFLESGEIKLNGNISGTIIDNILL